MTILEQALSLQQEQLRQAFAELRRDQPHSIELTRNAKGEYSYQIKLYFESPDIAPTTYLKALDAWLRDNFLPKGALDA